MKTFTGFLLIVVVGICFFTLLPAQEQDRLRDILIEEVLSIWELEGNTYLQKAGVTTDGEGNIYITDAKDYSIKKFNKFGQLIKEIGEMGDKPGEFQCPSLIEYFSGKLYVSESFKPGIQVFDEDLNFELKIPVRFSVTDLNVISNDEFFVSALAFDRTEEGDFNFCLYIFDPEEEKKDKKDKFINEKDRVIYNIAENFTIMNMVSFEIERDGNILIVYSWQDKIEKFSKDGNFLWTRNLFGNKKVKTRQKKGTKLTFTMYPLEVMYRATTMDIYGNLFILGGDLSENKNREVYVLSKHGEQLATFILPEPSNTIHIDSENYLYSRSLEGRTLRKYVLEYVYE
jgi:outer membrane protein assembly factor BamB